MQRDPQRQMHQRPRISREETKEPNDFIFNWINEESERSVNYARNLIQLSRDLVHNKWYDTFNFYFSKPINEILAQVNLPHVIAYKDNLFYDDETEYFKRYYKRNEVKPRMENITNFYFTLTEGVIRTTLPLHAQNSMILKRNDKLNKILLAKLQNIAGGDAQQAPNINQLNANVNPPMPELEDARPSDQQNQETGSRDPQRLSQNIDVIQANSFTIENPVLAPGVGDPEDEKSLDSVEHNIYGGYDPNMSMEDNVRSSVQKSLEKIVIDNRRREIKVGDAFQKIAQPDRRLQKPSVQTNVEPPQITNQYGSESNMSSPYSVEVPEKPSDSFKEQKLELKPVVDEEKEKRSSHTLPDNVSFSRKETSPNNSQHNESRNLGQRQSFVKEVMSTNPFLNSTSDLQSAQKTEANPKEEAKSTKLETSITHIHIATNERSSGGVRIEIGNVQVNQFSSLPVHQNSNTEPQPQPQSQPMMTNNTNNSEINFDIPRRTNEFNDSRPIETLFTEDYSDNQVTSKLQKSSAECVRDLMKKYYKVTDDDIDHPKVDRFKESSILAKLVAMKKNNAPPQTSREAYKNTGIREVLVKPVPRQLQKGRTNTEVTLYQLDTQQSGSVTGRMPNSPTSKKSYNRIKSIDGILHTQESSTSHILTRRSPDTLGDVNSNEVAKPYEPKKPVTKQHRPAKSIAGPIFQANVYKASHRAQDSISSTKVPSAYTTQPASATHKPDLKLDFNMVNQPTTRFDGVQGFLSCRSGKSDHLDPILSNRTSGHERVNSQTLKGDFLRQKYKQGEEAKKIGALVKPMGNYSKKIQQITFAERQKPTSFNAKLGGGELSDLGGKVNERRGHPTARTGSISFPVKQFVNRKITK